MIISASAYSTPLNRSITIISLVRTPFMKVLGLFFMLRIIMDSEGDGTNSASA